jgi:hypothetical protein
VLYNSLKFHQLETVVKLKVVIALIAIAMLSPFVGMGILALKASTALWDWIET